jgi:acyl carrier protein
MHPTDTGLISALAEILSDIAGVDPAEVTADKEFADDLDLDSLSMVELALAVEEKLGVRIPEEEASQLPTVGDMAAYLERARSGT